MELLLSASCYQEVAEHPPMPYDPHNKPYQDTIMIHDGDILMPNTKQIDAWPDYLNSRYSSYQTLLSQIDVAAKSLGSVNDLAKLANEWSSH